MTIALLGDVHGNALALQTVLEDARSHGASRFFNVGDSVGEAPFPNETIDLLIRNQVVSIRGNFDRNVIDFDDRIRKIKSRKHPARVAAIRFTNERINPKYREWLRDLPKQRTVEVDGVRIHVVHGSIVKQNEPIFPNTSESRLKELAALTDAHVIVCGHTHIPFVRPAAGKLFINTGSVGRPAGDPRACYVLAECGGGTMNAQIHRVAYPVERVLAAIDEYGLPDDLKDVFALGVKLTDAGD